MSSVKLRNVHKGYADVFQDGKQIGSVRITVFNDWQHALADDEEWNDSYTLPTRKEAIEEVVTRTVQEKRLAAHAILAIEG